MSAGTDYRRTGQTAVSLLAACGIREPGTERAMMSTLLDELDPAEMRRVLVWLLGAFRGEICGTARYNGEDGDAAVAEALQRLGRMVAS